MDIVYRSKALFAIQCAKHFRTVGVAVHGVSACRPADLAKIGWVFAADIAALLLKLNSLTPFCGITSACLLHKLTLLYPTNYLYRNLQ